MDDDEIDEDGGDGFVEAYVDGEGYSCSSGGCSGVCCSDGDGGGGAAMVATAATVGGGVGVGAEAATVAAQ